MAEEEDRALRVLFAQSYAQLFRATSYKEGAIPHCGDGHDIAYSTIAWTWW
jgi:hypothetical protein